MSTTGLNKRNGRQIASLAVGKFLALIFQFMLPIFLARFLSKEGYGIYAQFNMFEMLFVGTMNLALASGIYYFYPKVEHNGIRPILGNSVIMFFLASAIAFLLVTRSICGHWIMGDSPVYKYTPVIFIAVFCSLCSGLMAPLYVVTEDNRTALYYPLLEIILRVMVVIAVACWLGGLRGVIVGVLAARLLVLIVVAGYITWRSDRYSDHRWFDWQLLKAQLAYCLPFAASGALGTFTGRLDKLICVSYLTPAEYAVYVVAFLGIPGIEQFYSAIGDVCLTGMAKCFNNHDPKGALELLKDLEYKSVSVSFPIVFAVCLYADKVITLVFSDKYADATPYFRVFIFSMLFEMLASGLIVRASGKTRISMYTGIINAAIVIPTTFYFVRSFGIWGGIISVMIARLGQRLLYLLFEIRIVDANLRDYLPWKKLAAIFCVSSILLLPLLGLRYFFDLHWALCAALSAVYILVSFAAECYLGVFVITWKYLREKSMWICSRHKTGELSGNS